MAPLWVRVAYQGAVDVLGVAMKRSHRSARNGDTKAASRFLAIFTVFWLIAAWTVAGASFPL